MSGDQLLFITVVLAFVGFLAFLLVTMVQHRHQQAILRSQRELQTRLLDKVDSVEGLRSFFESPSSHALVEALRPRADEAYSRILSATVLGTALSVGGGAAAALRLYLQWTGNRWVGLDVVSALAFVLLTCGVALLLSAFVAYRLSRSWGLIKKHDEP
jgi:ABC-type multidrug transport system fused ATPase/permease subunit